MKFLVSYTHEKTVTITAHTLEEAAFKARAYVAARADRFPDDDFKLVSVETFKSEPEWTAIERELREA